LQYAQLNLVYLI